MSTKLKPHQVIQTLKEKKLSLFTPMEFKRIFGVSEQATRWFIKTHSQDGLFIKLRNGLYMVADSPASHYLIANRLFPPSYISFDTALSFYGIIPETIYAVTSATARVTRTFEIQGVSFTYHRVKRGAYAGYRPVKHQGDTILMAEPEKALADYLYFAFLKKRSFCYERMDLAKIDRGKLLRQVGLFQRPQMNQLVEDIYAEFGKFKRIG